MTPIELEYSRNYSEEVNVFLLNAPEIERFLIEQHGFLRTKFGGVATLDLSFNYASADFLGDKAGAFLGVTIEHDLSELKCQQVFATIKDGLTTFGGLLSFDVRSRIPAPKKIEPIDHRPNPCAWDGPTSCEEWGGLAFNEKRYCEKHALAPAMEEIIALRAKAKTQWLLGAEWVLETMERADDEPDYTFYKLLRRDMKLANPNHTPSSHSTTRS